MVEKGKKNQTSLFLVEDAWVLLSFNTSNQFILNGLDEQPCAHLRGKSALTELIS